MKLIGPILLYIIFAYATTQAQQIIYGTVIDSVTKEPIPFSEVSTDNDVKSITDFDGNFRINIKGAKTLHVYYVGYINPVIEIEDFSKDSITIDLVEIPYNSEDYFKIAYNPIDTLFYRNSQIKKIIYPNDSYTSYYKSGDIHRMNYNRNFRIWYKNGNLKYESRSTLHSVKKTEWFKSGQKKYEGYFYWGYIEEKNHGDWIKSDDWKYWNKKGKLLKK